MELRQIRRGYQLLRPRLYGVDVRLCLLPAIPPGLWKQYELRIADFRVRGRHRIGSLDRLRQEALAGTEQGSH